MVGGCCGVCWDAATGAGDCAAMRAEEMTSAAAEKINARTAPEPQRSFISTPDSGYPQADEAARPCPHVQPAIGGAEGNWAPQAFAVTLCGRYHLTLHALSFHFLQSSAPPIKAVLGLHRELSPGCAVLP